MHEFVSNSFDSPRDVVIQSRMPGLKDGGIIFLSPQEDLGGVDLADV